MGVWPPGVSLQGRTSNRLMLLRSKDAVVSDEEKAPMKVSGGFREDERKRTADEASKRVETLSKRALVSSAPISPGDTCLRPGWQPVYRRHDLCTGFNTERGNLDQIVSNSVHDWYRGGATRSSVEAPVMGVERRGRVIWSAMWSQPA